MPWRHRFAFVTALAGAAGCTYDAEVTFAQNGDLAAAAPTRSSGGPTTASPRAPSSGPRTESTPAATADDEAAPGDDPTPMPEPEPEEGEPPVPSGEPDDPALHGVVAAHNAVRSAVVPTPSVALGALEWSESAAAVARAWASHCTFGHNPGRGNLGENVYAASAGYGSTPTTVVQNWATESSDYDYASNSCSGVCGHYTQVVWRATTAVGCAVQQCSGGGPFGGGGWELWVCNYAPPGNYVGQRPY